MQRSSSLKEEYVLLCLELYKILFLTALPLMLFESPIQPKLYQLAFVVIASTVNLTSKCLI